MGKRELVRSGCRREGARERERVKERVRYFGREGNVREFSFSYFFFYF